MGRKGAFLVPFLIISIAALLLPYQAAAAPKKAARQTVKAVSSAPVHATVNDANVYDYLKAAEDQLKKGRTDESLRTLLAVHGYVVDNLQFMACASDAYKKADSSPSLAQDKKEALYLKQQRIGQLVSRYTKVRGESAYSLGLAYSKKGDAAQARKYLIEACRTVPFSSDPASLWMKSKDLFLRISNLDGEF